MTLELEEIRRVTIATQRLDGLITSMFQTYLQTKDLDFHMMYLDQIQQLLTELSIQTAGLEPLMEAIELKLILAAETLSEI